MTPEQKHSLEALAACGVMRVVSSQELREKRPDLFRRILDRFQSFIADKSLDTASMEQLIEAAFPAEIEGQ